MIQRLNSANCISFLPTGALLGSAKMGHLVNWTGGSVVLFICCQVGVVQRQGPRKDITHTFAERGPLSVSDSITQGMICLSKLWQLVPSAG